MTKSITSGELNGLAPKVVRKRQASRIKPQDRPFIAWDGEGANLDGPDLPQHYTLFGCSTGDVITSKSHLDCYTILDFIIKVGQMNPDAWHIGFAFGYDVNMIVKSLSESAIKRLHEKGSLTLRPREGHTYHLRYLPSKSFMVTRYEKDYDRKTNRHAKTTVRIFDIFSFFGTSFVKACKDLDIETPSVVVEGKKVRNEFNSLSEDYVRTYWTAEIEMLRQLADELRRRMYGANLRIQEWHGPGALATYANKQHTINGSMAKGPDEVREAARYAYAGGRFEMFTFGRSHGPIYSLDINSAYPHAIRQLPNLANGEWVRRECPTTVSRFGVYHVRLLPKAGDSFLPVRPGPLFHRDKMGNISFPWQLDGWYWSPEVKNLIKHIPRDRYEIDECWDFVEFSNDRPFDWVNNTYELRRQWKKQKNASQLALKLLLNSLYGKMAQRVGWNEIKRTPPRWHQLEWAGWVTSYCRAMLWDAMQRIPQERLIAVETDGLYTTMPPDVVLGDSYGRTEVAGIRSGDYASSTELGGWEVETYDEILYVQSGLAWLRKGSCPTDCRHDEPDENDEPDPRCAWTCKRRGLDRKTFRLKQCQDYLSSLKAGERWEAYTGRTTRFVGMGAALNSSAPFKLRHCVWQTVDREIRPGQNGKRIHVWKQCRACLDGQSGLDGAHTMSIRSLAYLDPCSHQHDIPWETGDLGYLQRETRDEGLIDPNEEYS